MKRLLSLLWMGLLMGLGLSAQNEGDHVAGDMHLRGTIGDKLQVEMLLACNHLRPFFSNTDANCLPLIGSYTYRTQLAPLQIQGKLCPATGTITLNVKVDGEDAECFEGKWNPQTQQVEGTWTLLKKGKSLPFQLQAVDGGYSDAQRLALLQRIREAMQRDPNAQGDRDPEAAIIDDAQWSEGSGKITGFSPGWMGNVYFFSPDRFEYATSFNSAAENANSSHIYQLLQSKTGTYVLHYASSTNSFRGYDGDEHLEVPKFSCRYALTVYQLLDGKFKEIGTTIWPNGTATGGHSELNAEGDCICRVWGDGILLPKGKKVYWDGARFVK